MTRQASSSPWTANNRRTSGSAVNRPARPKTRYFYFQRRSAVAAAMAMMFLVLLLLTLTCGWHLEAPRRSGARLLNEILLAAAAIPIWYKLPVTVPLLSECIAGAIARIILCTDKHPDFVISPRSVFGLGYMKYLRFEWSQVERVEVTRFQRKAAAAGDKPVALNLAFHSNVPRVDPVIGKLLGKHLVIRVNTGISEIDKLAILELVREYAPHTPIVETAQVIRTRF